jgi:hypothetical protein
MEAFKGMIEVMSQLVDDTDSHDEAHFRGR